MSYSCKYYLTEDGETWTEVTKEEYVAAERAAGFRNFKGKDEDPATAGFSSSSYKKKGKIDYVAGGEG